MHPSSSRSGGRLVLKGHGVVGSGRGLGSATVISRKRARDDVGVISDTSTNITTTAPTTATATTTTAATTTGGPQITTTAPTTATAATTTAATTTGGPQITHTRGTGTLRTSSTTVYGIGTRFLDEVKAGDVLEIGSEARPVAFVLSATSIGLSEPFSVDVAVPAPFTVAHLVEHDAATLDPVEFSRKAATARFADVERQTGAGTRIQIKGDSKGTYSFASAIGAAAASREDQLDARAKARGRDKFC
jgi:hypothetical protein